MFGGLSLKVQRLGPQIQDLVAFGCRISSGSGFQGDWMQMLRCRVYKFRFEHIRIWGGGLGACKIG